MASYHLINSSLHPPQPSKELRPSCPPSPTPSLQFLIELSDYESSPSPPPHTPFSCNDTRLASLPNREARTWYLDEIARAQAYIRSLQNRANAVAEINRLPNDLLSDIFNLVVQDDHQADRQVYMNLRLSAVCHRWRTVALESQLLWDVVDLSHLQRAQTFLSRASTAAVDAYLDNGFYGQGGGDPSRVDGPNLTATLLPHAHHISALYIEVPYNHMQELLESLDSCTFSNLINLRLLCPIEKAESRDTIQTIVYDPPGVQTVQELDLYKIIIPWYSQAYNNLRDLDLRHQVSNHANAPSMSLFLSVLERSPDLEYLRLSFAGPMLDPTYTSYPEPQRRLELKNLKSITLYNNPLDIGHLLAHLDFPSTTCLNLHAILSPSNTICDLFPRARHRPSVFSEISHLHLGYTKTYTECAWEDLSLHLQATSKESPHSRINVDFKWSDDGGNDAWAQGIPQSFRALPILFSGLPITHLELTCSYHAFLPSDWHVVLSSFPTLTSITAQPLSPAYYVPSANVEDLLEVLTPSLNPLVEPQSQVVCPELRRVKLGSFTMGNAFCGIAMDCVSARKSRDVGLCWVGLGHFNWTGDGEFVMPVWGECVKCRCQNDGETESAGAGTSEGEGASANANASGDESMEEKGEEKGEKVDVSDAESWKKCADPSKEWLEEDDDS